MTGASRNNPDGRDLAARPPGLVARMARWAGAHGRFVIAGWLGALVVATAVSHAAGTRYQNNLSLPGTDSQRPSELLAREFPAQAGDLDQIVMHVKTGNITAPTVRARVAPVLARVARLPHVSRVVSPFSTAGAGNVSRDRGTAFATIAFDDGATALPTAAINRVIRVAQSASSNSPQVELGGRAIEQTNQPSLGPATAIGLAAAIVVLLITFGSAMAAGLPIVTALLGLGTGLGLIGLESHLLDTPNFATQLAALLGLGMGIDYALFIITRFRENHHAGSDLEQAISSAMDTAGRAVLFAGATVIIALLGLFVLGITVLEAAALAAVVAVALVLAAALTALPVLLRRFGPQIAQNSTRRRRAPAREPFWPRWAALVNRHPLAGADRRLDGDGGAIGPGVLAKSRSE